MENPQLNANLFSNEFCHFCTYLKSSLSCYCTVLLTKLPTNPTRIICLPNSTSNGSETLSKTQISSRRVGWSMEDNEGSWISLDDWTLRRSLKTPFHHAQHYQTPHLLKIVWKQSQNLQPKDVKSGSILNLFGSNKFLKTLLLDWPYLFFDVMHYFL